MFCCRNLREILWFGAVGFVTSGADDRSVQFYWRDGRGIVGMFGQSSVAGLARNDDVLAQLLLIDDVGMAALADGVAGEGRGTGRDFGDGGSAIVAVLAKAARDDGGSQDNEDD